MRLIDADALAEKLGIGKDCSECQYSSNPYCKWKPNVVDVCEAIWTAPTESDTEMLTEGEELLPLVIDEEDES